MRLRIRLLAYRNKRIESLLWAVAVTAVAFLVWWVAPKVRSPLDSLLELVHLALIWHAAWVVVGILDEYEREDRDPK